MVTFTAPVNIALIKYWGKRNEELILPLAGSLSITLDQNQMCAKTTVAFSKKFPKDQFWLNNKEQSMDSPRLLACIKELRNSATQHRDEEGHIRICSSNNFPTAAGLASSAAGYACLVSSLAKLYGVTSDISAIARRGSGSACRSVLGGFAEWIRGEADDGIDSVARQVAAASHWPELRILVLVVNDKAKAIGSTKAMQNGVATSDFINYWAEHCVPKQLALLKEAILKKDFPSVANLAMKASNQLHALCLDSFPPVFYMNHISHAVVQLVHAFNTAVGKTRLGYTFDAGPNACLILEASDIPIVAAILCHFFPSLEKDFIKGLPVEDTNVTELTKLIGNINQPVMSGALHYIIHTQLGDEPKEVMDHLLNEKGDPI